MRFKTFLIAKDRVITRKKNFPEKGEDITGVEPIDIVGYDKGDDFIIVSKITWKRIELFAEILSAVDMSITDEKLNAVLGGRS